MIWMTRHLREVNLTYLGHLKQASVFCVGCAAASCVLFVHAVFPFVFEKTGSRIIVSLHSKMNAHK